jgi:hypothetical protein
MDYRLVANRDHLAKLNFNSSLEPLTTGFNENDIGVYLRIRRLKGPRSDIFNVATTSAPNCHSLRIFPAALTGIQYLAAIRTPGRTSPPVSRSQMGKKGKVVGVMKASRIAIAVVLAGVFETAQGEPAAVAGPAPAPQDCWVEHTQVQPSPARQGSTDAPVLVTVFGAMKDQRLGAEHPTAEQKKPCDVKAPRLGPGPDASGILPRSLAP